MKNGAEIVYTVQDGCFSYRATPVLESINLSLEKRKFYGLVGPNGSGKTTLLDLFTATSRLDSGTITFMGKPLETYPKKELARMLALVPQDFMLGFDYTVFDIVLMGRHPHIPRFTNPSPQDLALVDNAIKIMDIEEMRDRKATDLSGGEKQRVVVARALAQETEVIILDEATSNLDIRHTIDIMQIISDRIAQEDVTVIAAIHDLNLAASFCDELIVLLEGRVVACGPVADIVDEQLIRRVFAVENHVYINPVTKSPRIEYEFKKKSA